MSKKHYKPLVSFFVFILMLFIVNGSDNFNESIARLKSIDNDDIWFKIINDGYLKEVELRNLSLANTKLHRMVFSHNERAIKRVIQELQNSQHAMMNNSKHISVTTFRNTSSDALMKQYLYGFNGELEGVLSIIGGANNSEDLLLKQQILKLDELLKLHKTSFGPLKPMHKINSDNISDADMLEFENFYSMLVQVEHFISIIEPMAGVYFDAMSIMRGVPDPCKATGMISALIIEQMAGGHCDAVRGLISHLKIAMQYIGFKIGYPGIIKMQGRIMGVIQMLWQEHSTSGFGLFTQLIELDDINDDEYTMKLQKVLKNHQQEFNEFLYSFKEYWFDFVFSDYYR